MKNETTLNDDDVVDVNDDSSSSIDRCTDKDSSIVRLLASLFNTRGNLT